MNTKELKDKILQLAITGKLVKQNENDIPASELLKEIKLEKERLIKDKKIKKEKPLPEITEEEKDFELPKGWCMEKMGNFTVFKNGYAFKSSNFIEDGIGVIKIGNLTNGLIIEKKMVYVKEDKLIDDYIVNYNDLLIAMSGATTGKLAINKNNNKYYLNQRVGNIVTIKIDKKYLYYFLNTRIEKNLEISVGSAQPNLSTEQIRNILVFVPPLQEQKRIVEKIEQLFSLIDELEGNKQDLLQGIKKSREKVLQLAIEGKLVKQNENDTPAKVLLEEIKLEKERLIKEKKIKKEKPLQEITEEEKPFELPKGWEWCRLGELVQFNPRNKVDDDLEVSFIPMTLINDGYNFKHKSDVAIWKNVKTGFTHFRENDVVIAKITPCFENRKSAIMKNLKNKVGAGTTELYVFRSYRNTIIPQFLFNILISNRFIDAGKNTYTGTAGQQRIKKDFIQNYLIGVPPVEEQERIVEKVDELMEHFDTLEKQISS